jgi:hypothetical protein
LKEIHTKMLMKHLQRLEQPLESENILESDHDLKLKEDDSEHDVNGVCFLSFVYIYIYCCS